MTFYPITTIHHFIDIQKGVKLSRIKRSVNNNAIKRRPNNDNINVISLIGMHFLHSWSLEIIIIKDLVSFSAHFRKKIV